MKSFMPTNKLTLNVLKSVCMFFFSQSQMEIINWIFFLFVLTYTSTSKVNLTKILGVIIGNKLKGTDQAGSFISLKCVVYYANYRSWHQSSKIQVVS